MTYNTMNHVETVWITEELFLHRFAQITAGNVYRDLTDGVFYVKQRGYLSPVFASYPEGGSTQTIKQYGIKSKSMIVNELLSDL